MHRTIYSSKVNSHLNKHKSRDVLGERKCFGKVTQRHLLAPDQYRSSDDWFPGPGEIASSTRKVDNVMT